MNSLIEQKAKVAKLRDLYEKETDPMIKELMKSSLACARLLHDIVEYGVLEPEQVKPKTYKRVKYAAIAVSIAVLLAILFFSGCQTVKQGCHLVDAACQDIGWIANNLGNNITTEKCK